MVEEMQVERSIKELALLEVRKIEDLVREFAEGHDLRGALIVCRRTSDGLEWKIVEGRHEYNPKG